MEGHDAVKHPSHYVDGRKYEPKDVIRDWGLNFNLGNAVKYLSRAGRKGDKVEDLRKAQEYIQFEIDALKAESEQNNQTDQVSLCGTCNCTFPKCPAQYDDITYGESANVVISCKKYINKK